MPPRQPVLDQRAGYLASLPRRGLADAGHQVPAIRASQFALHGFRPGGQRPLRLLPSYYGTGERPPVAGHARNYACAWPKLRHEGSTACVPRCAFGTTRSNPEQRQPQQRQTPALARTPWAARSTNRRPSPARGHGDARLLSYLVTLRAAPKISLSESQPAPAPCPTSGAGERLDSGATSAAGAPAWLHDPGRSRTASSTCA